MLRGIHELHTPPVHTPPGDRPYDPASFEPAWAGKLPAMPKATVPRTPPFEPVGPLHHSPDAAMAGLDLELITGASSISDRYHLRAKAANEAVTTMACNAIYTAVREHRVPTEKEWTKIVLGVLSDKAVHVPVGSQPWRGLEHLKDAAAGAITGDHGEVDGATADDVVSSLGCAALTR